MGQNVTTIDWSKPVRYVVPDALEPTWWERGQFRYAVLSYGLWGRNILIDLRVIKKKRKVVKK